MLPAVNSGKVTLLDSKPLVNQIANLERRVARGGRESIDQAKPSSSSRLLELFRP